MNISEKTNSMLINATAFIFSAALLAASAASAFIMNTGEHIFFRWYRLMITPCPLVTDYFSLSGLSTTLLNAGACGMICVIFMLLLKGRSTSNTLAGFFLVIAHCFYGLNLLNMLPCFLAPFIYLRIKKLNFKENLAICMFSTAFGPFLSELLFRYTQQSGYIFGQANLTVSGIIYSLLFIVTLAFIIPAILPGAKRWHKGYNLYNGGMAFGIFGFFLYSLVYRTFNVPAPTIVNIINLNYESAGHSYPVFCNIMLGSIFLLCLVLGFMLNGFSFSGYRSLIKSTGFSTDFSSEFGMPLCMINIGIYGFMFLIYMNLIIHFTNGAGFTAPTVGVILASLTFTAMGQHPRNVWPIMAGYVLLYMIVSVFSMLQGKGSSWTISSQTYINGVAFATGLCPIVGRYGRRAGILAGVLCAAMCSATKDLHGGLMLYNGGLTAGLTAIILVPVLEHYLPEGTRDEMPPIRPAAAFTAAASGSQDVSHQDSEVPDPDDTTDPAI